MSEGNPLSELWLYATTENQVQGPVSAESIVAMLNQGVLTGDTKVCRHGAEQWQAIEDSVFSAEMVKSIGFKGGKIIGFTMMAILLLLLGIYMGLKGGAGTETIDLDSSLSAIQELNAKIIANHTEAAYRLTGNAEAQASFVSAELQQFDARKCPTSVQVAFTEYIESWDVLMVPDAENKSLDSLLLHLAGQKPDLSQMPDRKILFNHVINSYNRIGELALADGVYLLPVREL